MPDEVAELIAQLTDVKGAGRLEACRRLGHIGDRRALPRLLNALRTDALVVRVAAAAALGDMGDPRAVEALVACLSFTASESTSEEEDQWRRDAVDNAILGSYPGPPFRDRGPALRRAAAEALGKLGDKRAVAPLLTALTDEHPDVRQAAANALEKLGAAALCHAILLALESRSDDRERGQRELAALAREGNRRAVPALLAALQQGPASKREAAAAALGQAGDSRAVEPLLVALADEDEGIRAAAVEALRTIGEPRRAGLFLSALAGGEGCSRLAAMVRAGDDQVTRIVTAWLTRGGAAGEAAAQTLAQVSDAWAVDLLVDALAKGAGATRAVVEALGATRATQAVEPLIATLRSYWPYEREAAAKALGRIGDPRAIEPLIERLGDCDGDVRRAAGEALLRLGEEQLGKAITGARGAEEEIKRLTALARQGDQRAAGALVGWLAARDARLLSKAMDALEALGSTAVPSLVAALSTALQVRTGRGSAWIAPGVDRDDACRRAIAVLGSILPLLRPIPGAEATPALQAFREALPAWRRAAAWGSGTPLYVQRELLELVRQVEQALAELG